MARRCHKTTDSESRFITCRHSLFGESFSLGNHDILLKEKKHLAPISFPKGMRLRTINSHAPTAQYQMSKESHVGSRATHDVSLVVLRKFGSRHQPLGYYRLNDKPVKNIRGLLAEQNERRLHERKEFENVHQQSIAFKLLALKTTTNSTSKTSRSIVASNQAARLNLWIVVPLGLRDFPQIQGSPVRPPKMPLPPRSPQKSSHFVSSSVCPPVSLYANLSRSDDDIL